MLRAAIRDLPSLLKRCCQIDTAGVSQVFVQNADLADAERERFGSSGARHVSLKAAAYHAHTLQFPLTQRERPFAQQVTFSHCR